jgi:hypothetical protein
MVCQLNTLFSESQKRRLISITFCVHVTHPLTSYHYPVLQCTISTADEISEHAYDLLLIKNLKREQE